MGSSVAEGDVDAHELPAKELRVVVVAIMFEEQVGL
jgi:hypothetical protein